MKSNSIIVGTFFLTIIITLLNLDSCNAQNTTSKSFQGFWQQEGYGRVLEFKKDNVIIHDVSDLHCDIIEEGSFLEAQNEYAFKKISNKKITAQEGITVYQFNKIEKLPKICTHKTKNKKDPIYNFDVVTQIFDENYCYFKERNIDWSALKLKYRSKVNNNTKPIELAILIDNMFEEINDGHLNLFLPNKIDKKLQKHKNLVNEKQKLLGSQDIDKLSSMNIDDIRLKTIKNYVKKVKTYHYGLVNYGLLNKDIAYVQLNGMMYYANYDIPEGTSKKQAERILEKQANKSLHLSKDEVDGAGYIADKIISEINNTKVCIIDIRFNPGGSDEIGLEILKRFATTEGQIFTKKAKTKNGFTDKQNIYLKPSKNVYQGKVYLLTSHETASAAEIFTLASMTANPNIVRIGSNTEGVFSDILVKRLPNGWLLGLSNEIYESRAGKSYEVIGIEPQYKIEYPNDTYSFFKEFQDGKPRKDKAVEKVLELENIKL